MPKAQTKAAALAVVDKPLSFFRPHPENPRGHPPDQVALLAERLKKFGWYKNVVARSDGTLLAGHGMIQAAESLGMETAPVVLYDGDDMDAVELMVGDNHASDLAVDDTAKLVELQELLLAETGSMGTTGITEGRLAELRAISDAEAEVRDATDKGDDGFVPGDESKLWRITIQCEDEAQCERLCEALGVHWDIRSRTHNARDLRVGDGQ